MTKKDYTNAKIAFIHGRPGPHPTHTALARSVGAEFFFVDRVLRYHDLENSGKFRRYASWILNSLLFKDAKKYDLILSEGMHLPPVIMKKLKVLRPDQKIAAVLGDEFLFFLQTKWFSPKTQKIMRYALGKYDALLCMSEFQAELAHQIYAGHKRMPEIILAHEIISGDRPTPNPKDFPKLNGKRLLFVAHGPSGWRGYYKGIETLLASFKLVADKHRDAQLTVVGDWDENYINDLLMKTKNTRDNIHFVGRQKDLLGVFKNSDLCVHVTNGDAFPIATLEAIRAGLPTIVSNLTGTKEVVAQISERLVVPMKPEIVSETVEWYFNLPLDEKKQLVEKGIKVMLDFSEEKGIEEFKAAINTVLN